MIRPFLVGVVSERELDLATVAPAQTPPPPPPGPGRGRKKAEKLPVTGTGSFSVSGNIQEQRLRAIAERAPEPVKDLYRRGLLGQKEAAKLGPKNAKPEDAERVTRIGPRRIKDDHDNLCAAAKHVVDGVADALGVDDGDRSKVSWTYAQERGGYGVRIELLAPTNKEATEVGDGRAS